jgi:hypothetical protein
MDWVGVEPTTSAMPATFYLRAAMERALQFKSYLLHVFSLPSRNNSLYTSKRSFENELTHTAAPIQTMLANQPQERREEILKAVTESARKYAENDTGSMRLSNEAICVVGTK